MPTLTINEMAVHYRVQGQAGQPTLVLVYGLGCSLKYWNCVFEAPQFAAYRIIALDLPGFGGQPNRKIMTIVCRRKRPSCWRCCESYRLRSTF